METLDDFRSAQAELRQMIDDLRTLLAPEQLQVRPNARRAFELVCELTRRVRDHLNTQDRELYNDLLAHDDPRNKSVAWEFILDHKPLRRAFEDYRKRWLRNCAFTFSDGFLAETHRIFELVDQRLAREERLLLPTLVEIGVFQGARI